MKIEAVKLNDIIDEKTDIYTSIMVISNRARQIIDKRFLEQINLEDLEDSEELVHFSKEDFDKEKPMMQAYQEFLDKELEWQSSSKEDSDA
jgi:DNA-directed RNA polymerase subunit K/omega|tara:strand:- start:312 stop:584 length:273 start_codon:yes stop_codon:yes gene_type:complete